MSERARPNLELIRRCYRTMFDALVTSGMDSGAADAVLRDYAEHMARVVRGAMPEPMHMALCESQSVVLREGQPYTFRKVGDCEKCAAMSAASLEAYGEPKDTTP